VSPSVSGERYSRQIALPGIGIEGQRRLRGGSVLVIGAGGLGSPALLYLAAAGVGRIGVIDDDLVALSNLQRQVLFAVADLGKNKALAARARLRELNPGVEIEAYPERLDAARAVDLFPRYDVVIDGCDDFETKLLASDAGRKFGVPVVHGSVLRFDGQVAVFSDGEGPCLRCLFPEPPAHETPCAEAGVLGAVTGWVGSVQALEAIKLLLRSPELPPIEGKLAILDGVALSLRTVGIPKREGCATCSVPREAVRLVPAREPASPSLEEISAEELARLLRNGSPLRLVDVREAEETRAGAIEGAIH
jgi:adenylyltransferase/sulfurtransferase